jgi:hypothetical protein
MDTQVDTSLWAESSLNMVGEPLLEASLKGEILISEDEEVGLVCT